MGPPQKRKKKKLRAGNASNNPSASGSGPSPAVSERPGGGEADRALRNGFIVSPAAGPATKAKARDLLRVLKLPQQIIDQVLKGFLGVKLSSDGYIHTFTQSDGGHYVFQGP